jgi:hypothetical protein
MITGPIRFIFSSPCACFRDIQGQRSKTQEISNKSTIQARVMMLSALDSFWLAAIKKKKKSLSALVVEI